MKSSLTPTLDANNQVVTPEITPITAEFIKAQRAESALRLAASIKAYTAPDGFTANTTGYEYQIGAQDVLHITVWGQSLTTTNKPSSALDHFEATVDSEGLIYYPYVGNLKVLGKTLNETRELLHTQLATIFNTPQVHVKVAQFNSQKTYITGAVNQPRALAITNVPLTVFSAISSAGGPLRCTSSNLMLQGNTTLCADLKNVQVTRQGRRTILDLDTLTAIDGSSVNWILENEDKVYVPNNTPYRIFVLGSVVNPGPYSMNEGRISLREALGNAHGVTIMSDPSYTYVIRNHERQPQVFSLDAHSPDSFNLAGDFELKAEDIVFVSSSKLETLNAVLNQVNPSLLTAVSTKALVR